MAGLITKINYDTPTNFDYDVDKIEFVDNKATLKLFPYSQNYVQTFLDGTGFTHDNSKADFKGLANFHATFTDNEDADYSDGTPDGTLVGDASVSSGVLNSTSSNDSYCEWNGDNMPIGNRGCVRLKHKPNYSGAPVGNKYIFTSSKGVSDIKNFVRIMHTGNLLRLDIYNAFGTSTFTGQTGNTYVAVAGVESEIEFNWDADTGKYYYFNDGVLIKEWTSNKGVLGPRTIMRVGHDYTNGIHAGLDAEVSDIQVFDDVQHTASYTPTSLPVKRLRQVNQFPQSTFGANFNSSKDANWSNGSGTVTLNGSAVLANNRIECLDYASAYLQINPSSHLQLNEGAIKFKYTPNYSGTPSESLYLITKGKDNGVANNLDVRHNAGSGTFTVSVTNNAGTLFINHNLDSWVPVAGQTYEFELNYNLSTSGSELRLFIDGVQNGTTATGAGIISDQNNLKIGTNQFTNTNSNGSFDDIVLYDQVQHVASYTPGYAVDDGKYIESKVDFPAHTYSGLGEVQDLLDLTTTQTGAIKYIFNGKYFDGADWVTSDGTYLQSNSLAIAVANFSSLGVLTGSTINISLVFGISNSLGLIDNFDLDYNGQIYPQDNPIIKLGSPLFMTQIFDMDADEDKTGSDEIKYTMEYMGQHYWIDGGAVVASNGTYAEANTITETKAFLDTMTIDIAPDSFVNFHAHLHSDDGSTRPSLESVTFDYDFSFNLSDVEKCMVTGTVFDNSGNAVSGATVEFDSKKDYLYNDNLIARKSTFTTDSDGKFFATLVETESTGQQVTCTISYTEGTETKTKVYKRLDIPNKVTETLSTIVANSA